VKVIVFASSKGGVGKTTLAFNAAIHAARTGARIQLLDVDPQRSLMELCRRRRATPELVADNPTLFDGKGPVADAVATLEVSGFAGDYLIVDTPGSFVEILEEAIGQADVVVLPLRPSPLDLLAQQAVADMVTEMGKRDRTIFVINMADPRSPLTVDAVRAIKPLSPHRPAVVAQRQDYARAAITARAGVEVNREAATEIAALWDAIAKVARTADVVRAKGKPGKPGKVRARGAR
jgi:chromosome partitioning protein